MIPAPPGFPRGPPPAPHPEAPRPQLAPRLTTQTSPPFRHATRDSAQYPEAQCPIPTAGPLCPGVVGILTRCDPPSAVPPRELRRGVSGDRGFGTASSTGSFGIMGWPARREPGEAAGTGGALGRRVAGRASGAGGVLPARRFSGWPSLPGRCGREGQPLTSGSWRLGRWGGALGVGRWV
jgi:hypothetical protein